MSYARSPRPLCSITMGISPRPVGSSIFASSFADWIDCSVDCRDARITATNGQNRQKCSTAASLRRVDYELSATAACRASRTRVPHRNVGAATLVGSRDAAAASGEPALSGARSHQLRRTPSAGPPPSRAREHPVDDVVLDRERLEFARAARAFRSASARPPPAARTSARLPAPAPSPARASRRGPSVRTISDRIKPERDAALGAGAQRLRRRA